VPYFPFVLVSAVVVLSSAFLGDQRFGVLEGIREKREKGTGGNMVWEHSL
jgi:hypothetical protein